LGIAGFFAIGGYTSGLLTTYNLHPRSGQLLVSLLQACGLLVAGQDMYGADLLVVRPWAACVVALLVTTGIAYLVGKPVLKLRGHYLAMATLGFGTIVYKVVLGSSLWARPTGISDISRLSSVRGAWWWTGKSALRGQNYYVAWGLVLAAWRCSPYHQFARWVAPCARSTGPKMQPTPWGWTLAVQAADVRTQCRAGGFGGRISDPLQRRHWPFRGFSHEVRALRGHCGGRSAWRTCGARCSWACCLNFLSLRGSFGSYDDAVFGLILLAIHAFRA